MGETAVARGGTLVESGGGGRRGGAGGSDETGGTGDFSMVPLGWLAGGFGVVALVLYGLQQSLRLPSGFGIEDVFGWHTPAVIAAAVANWCPPISDRWWGAAGYILADTALFIPIYGALILAAARSLHKALEPGPAPFAHLLHAWLQPATRLLVAVLWIVDAIENYGGAQRIGVSTWSVLVALLVAAMVFVSVWRTVLADERAGRRLTCLNVGVLFVAVLIVVGLVVLQDKSAACRAAGTPGSVDFALAWAHHAKPAFVGAALSPVALAFLAWWFGLDLDLLDPRQERLAELRAAFRAGVAGVIGRTRYVLLLLALFATFTLVLDQSRDVLLALAGPPEDADKGGAARAWRLFILVLGAGSVAMLAYSSWLWTRLVGMVKRPGLSLPGGHAVYDKVGEFARGWARAVAMAPLVIVCLLIAHTAGDAAAAARATNELGVLLHTLCNLLLFGVVAVAGGYVFLEIRRQLPLHPPSKYYNSEDDVYALLREGTVRQRKEQASPPPDAAEKGCFHFMHRLTDAFARTRFAHRVGLLGRPIAWPLLALGLMVVVRACMAWWPDTTAPAPATLALLCLALVWWMGAAGAISLAEQRQTIPWGVVLLVVVGLLSLVVDNHVLPLTVIGSRPLDGALSTLRLAGLVVTVALAAVSVVWWLAATWTPAPGAGAPAAPPGSLRWIAIRAGIAAVAFGLLVPVLFAVDRWTSPLFQDAGPPPRGKLDQALSEWVEKLPGKPGTDPRVFLVASEGGGSRSAYWTARVLAELHDRNGLDFDARTLVHSGVSGGAVGEAVYRACVLDAERSASIVECVETKFARLDPLSPLIGSFLFEDVFARLLPLDGLSICRQPGCGFLSRALGFEREWMRQFPKLAEPIVSERQGLPALMLNSTEVETGNRVVFSTLPLSEGSIPASVGALQRLRQQTSLIAAAHSAARFPFVNPLAVLRPRPDAPDAEARDVGHLADGGYHDNSGAESVADLWRVLRTMLPEGWHAQLVLIRNGQVKPGCEGRPRTEPSAYCLSAERRRIDLSLPVEKPLLDLYADLLGPPVALVNVSGIGAHARQAAAALNAGIRGPVGAVSGMPPCLLDQTTAAALVPLGWYLSRSARQALNAEVDAALRQRDCFPATDPKR